MANESSNAVESVSQKGAVPIFNCTDKIQCAVANGYPVTVPASKDGEVGVAYVTQRQADDLLNRRKVVKGEDGKEKFATEKDKKGVDRFVKVFKGIFRGTRLDPDETAPPEVIIKEVNTKAPDTHPAEVQDLKAKLAKAEARAQENEKLLQDKLAKMEAKMDAALNASPEAPQSPSLEELAAAAKAEEEADAQVEEAKIEAPGPLHKDNLVAKYFHTKPSGWGIERADTDERVPLNRKITKAEARALAVEPADLADLLAE